MKMERIERVTGKITYEVTDDDGHTIILTPRQAHELLDWLHHAVTQDDGPTTDKHTSI